MSFETVRYTYRLRPGAAAERALLGEWGRCRWLWNEAVHQQQTGRKPTVCKLSRLLTEARAAFSWLREGSQVAQQQALRAYMRALEDSFKVPGRGRPKAKPRKTADGGVGALKRTLIEYGTRAGRRVVLVQPAYTTMTCSECGERQARLGLAERTFSCRSCGYTAGRDRNAARVILAVAERGHARADDVSHWRPPSGSAGAV